MSFAKKHWNILRHLKQRRHHQREILRRFAILHWRQDFRNLDTFHRALRPCFLLAHIFGIMPLANSLQSNPYRVAFKINSLPFTTTFLFLIFGGWKTINVSANLLLIGLNAKNIIGLIFFAMCLTIFLNFLNMARSWPHLLVHWTRIDLIFLMPPYEPPKWSLRKQLRTLTVVFWTTALVENCLYYASHYYNFVMKHLNCHPEDPRQTYKEYLIMELLSDVFNYFPYNIVVVICALFLNAAFTVTWNFMDFFIMAVSLGLTTRFQQFAARIEPLAGSYVPDALWNQIRRQHIILCEFMEIVNDHLSTIVLVSTVNNMYFICNQLLNIFTRLRYTINYAYFWFSLIFLLMRTCCMFMFASRVHDASLMPLKILYVVPSGCWTEEVQRFMAQILNEPIGLTGKNFYMVTRKGLFGMLATIVTYEFMLLQLDAKSREAGLPDLCS